MLTDGSPVPDARSSTLSPAMMPAASISSRLGASSFDTPSYASFDHSPDRSSQVRSESGFLSFMQTMLRLRWLAVNVWRANLPRSRSARKPPFDLDQRAQP